jgi:hypothetical protein
MIGPTAFRSSRGRPRLLTACAGARASRIVVAILLVSLAAGVGVWIVRVASAVRIDRPYLAATSGCEEEMLFSVWKGIHGLPVYNDPWLPPFTDSAYGWLFFHAYAAWSAGWLAVLGLDDTWLPTVSRGFTLVGMAMAIAMLAGLCRDIGRGVDGSGRRAAVEPTAGEFPGAGWLLAGVALVNPLFHWWSFTTRPDVWALALELAALRAGVRAVGSGRFSSLLLFALPAYLAWSFRQSNVSVLVGLGCALAVGSGIPAAFFPGLEPGPTAIGVGRAWHLPGLVVVMAVAFAATFATLGKNFYESAIVAMTLAGDVRPGRIVAIAASAVTKDPLLAVSAVALLPLLIVRRGWLREPATRLLVFTAAFALVFNLALSARAGSDTNYHFPAAAFLPPAVLAACGGDRRGRAWRNVVFGAGALGLLVAGLFVLAGFRGRLRAEDDAHVHRLRALADRLERPIFCTHVAANVPWVLGDGPESMVVGFPYAGMLRARPERFTAGTVERMLRDGTFATIVFADRHGWWQEADADLSGYVPGPACPGSTIWVKPRPPL